LLDRLAQAHAPALAAARQLGGTAPVAAAQAPVAVDAAIVAARRQELRDLLKRRGLRARAAFEALAQAQGLSEQATASHPVKQALDRLDFEEALRQVEAEVEADAAAQTTMIHAAEGALL